MFSERMSMRSHLVHILVCRVLRSHDNALDLKAPPSFLSMRASHIFLVLCWFRPNNSLKLRQKLLGLVHIRFTVCIQSIAISNKMQNTHIDHKRSYYTNRSQIIHMIVKLREITDSCRLGTKYPTYLSNISPSVIV